MSDAALTMERKTERRHRAKAGLGLFITDTELIELLGVPPDVARPVLATMDRCPSQYNFPPKLKVWGDRRYRPAVEQWLMVKHGFKMNASRRD